MINFIIICSIVPVCTGSGGVSVQVVEGSLSVEVVEVLSGQVDHLAPWILAQGTTSLNP